MPQLNKVVLAVGNRLIYADSYEEALAQLAGTQSAAAPGKPVPPRLPLSPPCPPEPTSGSTAFGNISAATESWRRKDVSQRRGKNWKRSTPTRRSSFTFCTLRPCAVRILLVGAA